MYRGGTISHHCQNPLQEEGGPCLPCQQTVPLCWKIRSEAVLSLAESGGVLAGSQCIQQQFWHPGEKSVRNSSLDSFFLLPFLRERVCFWNLTTITTAITTITVCFIPHHCHRHHLCQPPPSLLSLVTTSFISYPIFLDHHYQSPPHHLRITILSIFSPINPNK